MKLKHYIIGVAAAALLGACSSEELVTTQKTATANNDGNVSITISLPGSEFNNPYSLLSASATRANNAVNYGTGSTSALGGITNLDMTKYDVRYKIAVYEDQREDKSTAATKDDYKQVVDTRTVTVDKYQEITESFRLLPTHTYRIVCWADFVEQGKTEDFRYNTTDLKSIKLKDENEGKNLNDETRDAYYKYIDVTATTDGKIVDSGGNEVSSIVLKRPFAKVRLVTTDWNYGKLEMPKLLKITYKQGIKRFNGIDAVTGNDTDGEEAASAGASGQQTTDPSILSADLECSTIIDPTTKQYLGYSVVENGETKNPGTVPTDPDATDDDAATTDGTKKSTRIIQDYDYQPHDRTLTVDYLMTDESDQTTVAFDYEAYADAEGTKLLYKHSFSNDIPIKRNYITTILGNLLTVGGQFDVAINENFKNEWVYADAWWDPTQLTPTEPVIASDGSYHIYDRNQFAWLAETETATYAGSTTEAPSFKNRGAFNKGVYLEADIDMNNIDWQPISNYTAGNATKSLFDGKGHVLRNFKIQAKYGTAETSAIETGVFSRFIGTMKNVTFENITINGLYGSKDHSVNPYEEPYSTEGFENADAAGCIGRFGGNMENVNARHVFIRGFIYNQTNGTDNVTGKAIPYLLPEFVGGLIGKADGIGSVGSGVGNYVDGTGNWNYTNPWENMCTIKKCSAEDIHIVGACSGGLIGVLWWGYQLDGCKTDHIYIRHPYQAGRFVGAVGGYTWFKTNNSPATTYAFLDDDGNTYLDSEGKTYTEEDTEHNLYGHLLIHPASTRGKMDVVFWSNENYSTTYYFQTNKSAAGNVRKMSLSQDGVTKDEIKYGD